MVGSEKGEVGDLGPLQDLWTLYSLVKQARDIAIAFRSGIQWMRQSDTVQSNIAFVRVMARNTVFPTILERIDDGTNPEEQRLRIDMALTFPRERIDSALYYKASQSMKNLVEQFWRAVDAQVSRDAQPGDERTLLVTLDYMDSAAIYTYAIRVLVGGEWSYIRPQTKEIHYRQLWCKAREIQAQYLAQDKAKHKAKHKQ